MSKLTSLAKSVMSGKCSMRLPFKARYSKLLRPLNIISVIELLLSVNVLSLLKCIALPSKPNSTSKLSLISRLGRVRNRISTWTYSKVSSLISRKNNVFSNWNMGEDKSICNFSFDLQRTAHSWLVNLLMITFTLSSLSSASAFGPFLSLGSPGTLRSAFLAEKLIGARKWNSGRQRDGIRGSPLSAHNS